MLARPERKIHVRTFTDPNQGDVKVTLALRVPNAIDICAVPALVNEMISRYITGGDNSVPFNYDLVSDDEKELPVPVSTTREFWEKICSLLVAQPSMEEQAAGGVKEEDVYAPYECEELAQIALKMIVAWPQMLEYYYQVLGWAVTGSDNRDADDPNV
tara:strand:+ start:845 stop:1318 length:474 start_codon:yes stop_codon:yes gene_type:complete